MLIPNWMSCFPCIAGKFFLYLLFMFLTFTYFTFYGQMAVGLTSSQHLAAVISSAFYSLWNLLSGFLVPKPVSKYNVHHTATIASFMNSINQVSKYKYWNLDKNQSSSLDTKLT